VDTVKPEELLESWELGNLPVKTAIGHILQALLMQSLETKANVITLHCFRRKINRLVAHTDLPPLLIEED
jgi:hypothetical protein